MAQATLSCPFGAIHLESDWGPLPVSTLPAAVLTVIAPRPPTTGAGPFGCLVNSGGQNQDLFPSYSRALGPIAIKICKLLPSIVHRLVPAYLFGAVAIDCPTALALPD